MFLNYCLNVCCTLCNAKNRPKTLTYVFLHFVLVYYFNLADPAQFCCIKLVCALLKPIKQHGCCHSHFLFIMLSDYWANMKLMNVELAENGVLTNTLYLKNKFPIHTFKAF